MPVFLFVCLFRFLPAFFTAIVLFRYVRIEIILFQKMPATFRTFRNIRLMMVFLEIFYPYEFVQILHVTVILVSVIIYEAGFIAMVFVEIIVFLLTIQRTVSNIKCDVTTSVIICCPLGLIVPLE